MWRHLDTGTVAVTLVMGLGACGGDDAESRPDPDPPVTCPAGEVALPRGCQVIGVPPAECGAGFEPDGDYGCRPILPPEPCPPGMHALPGATECHEVAPCAAGTWGDIPVDGTTEHVDASYTGGSSDGTAAHPWTTVGQAISAAAPGAIIAIAAGTYAENLSINGKAVRLWGVCPSQVTIAGVAGANQAIIIGNSDGLEVRSVAITGPMLGLASTAVQNVVIDRVWVHDTGAPAIEAVDIVGPASITITNSLLENVATGVHLGGAQAVIEDTTIRDVLDPFGTFSMCVGTEPGPNSGAPSSATIRRVVAERCTHAGISGVGTVATIEDSLIRFGQPDSNGEFGNGITAIYDLVGGVRAHFEVHRSVVEQSTGGGIWVGASDALVTNTVVQDTFPQPLNQRYGYGFEIIAEDTTGIPANVLVQHSVVRRAHGTAALVAGANATFEQVIFRDTLPGLSSISATAKGLSVQSASTGIGVVPGAAGISNSLIQNTQYVGIAVYGSQLWADNLFVLDAGPNEIGKLGDGISGAWSDLPSELTLVGSRIENTARAGISGFGATIHLQGTSLECNAFALHGETSADVPGTFNDNGGNTCGCNGEQEPCKVQSVGLEPPAPLDAQPTAPN